MYLVSGMIAGGAVVVFAAVALWKGRVNAVGFCGVGLIGVIIFLVGAKFPEIRGFKLQGGTSPSLDVQMQEVQQKAQQIIIQAQQVSTDTAEVREMREQIADLLKRVKE